MGINIDIIEPVAKKEIFFFYEPEDRGYRCIATFFLCKPGSAPTRLPEANPDPDLMEAEWIPISELTQDRISDYTVTGEVASEISAYLKKYLTEEGV